MKTEIITIGDEILIGQIVDTNSAWIAEQLNAAGFTVVRKLSVGDTRDAILDALDEALATSDAVILTGGLGPTKDDITKTTLGRAFRRPHGAATKQPTSATNASSPPAASTTMTSTRDRPWCPTRPSSSRTCTAPHRACGSRRRARWSFRCRAFPSR